MADKKFSKKGSCDFEGVSGSSTGYSKLILLRDCIKDIDNDISSLRQFVNNVSNEIYVTNEKITSMLSGNQKRLDLLKELENKVALAEYRKSCFVEEFIDLVPFPLLRDYYNGLLNVTNDIKNINLE